MMNQEELFAQQRAFEQFVMSGSYAEKQECAKNAEKAKEGIRDILASSEERFHQFDDCGMVAIFTPKEVRETDHIGLAEEIMCYVRSEALSQIITLDSNLIAEDEQQEIVQEYMYKPTYYVKAALNKLGKTFNYTLKEDYTGATLNELLLAVKYQSATEKHLDKYYRKIMAPFNMMEQKKLQTDIGSISKIPNKPVWDIHQMVQEIGEDFILKYAKVNLTKLEEWIQIGAVPQNIKSQYQETIDIRLEFSVMTIEARNRALNAFYAQRSQRNII